MIFNFAFIVTNGTKYVDGRGKLTTDRKRAERFPYQTEAKRVAAAFGPSYRAREVE